MAASLCGIVFGTLSIKCGLYNQVVANVDICFWQFTVRILLNYTENDVGGGGSLFPR